MPVLAPGISLTILNLRLFWDPSRELIMPVLAPGISLTIDNLRLFRDPNCRRHPPQRN